MRNVAVNRAVVVLGARAEPGTTKTGSDVESTSGADVARASCGNGAVGRGVGLATVTAGAVPA